MISKNERQNEVENIACEGRSNEGEEGGKKQQPSIEGRGGWQALEEGHREQSWDHDSGGDDGDGYKEQRLQRQGGDEDVTTITLKQWLRGWRGGKDDQSRGQQGDWGGGREGNNSNIVRVRWRSILCDYMDTNNDRLVTNTNNNRCGYQ